MIIQCLSDNSKQEYCETSRWKTLQGCQTNLGHHNMKVLKLSCIFCGGSWKSQSYSLTDRYRIAIAAKLKRFITSRWPKCTQVYTSIHKCTQVYTSIHKCTQVYTRIHKYTQEYTRIHKYTQVYASIHKYTQVYTSIHKYTQVYTSMHK